MLLIKSSVWRRCRCRRRRGFLKLPKLVAAGSFGGPKDDDDLRESDNVTKHDPRSIYKLENDSSANRLTEAYSLGSQHKSSLLDLHVMVNRPFSKMAAENSIK